MKLFGSRLNALTGSIYRINHNTIAGARQIICTVEMRYWRKNLLHAKFLEYKREAGGVSSLVHPRARASQLTTARLCSFMLAFVLLCALQECAAA